MLFLKYCCVFLMWTLHIVRSECPPIVRKKEWDGIIPQHVVYFNTTVDLIIIQHTVTQSCSDDKSCAEVVREIQKIHTKKAFLWDIGPSFLIASTGKVYEGRGWNHCAVHTSGYNKHSIGIAFIGNFNNQEPSSKALISARALIDCGVAEGQLTPDHRIVAHNQLINTESPGKMLASKIMSWTDWTSDVSEIKKLADKEDLREVTEQFQILNSTANLILTSPKQIDLLSSIRDAISELIDNMSQLAQLNVKAANNFSNNLNKVSSVFAENVSSKIKEHKDKFFATISTFSGLQSTKSCIHPIEEKAKSMFDDTQAKAKACGDQNVKKVDENIKHLEALSSDAINVSNAATEDTRNCTELNFGIESLTRACLSSVNKQTQGASDTFQSQANLTIETIKTLMGQLTPSLEQCLTSHILSASTETTKLISTIRGCSPFPAAKTSWG